MSILDGIKTLDEALACLFQVKHSQYAVFVKDGNVYCEPKDIGDFEHLGWQTAEEWTALFTAHYAKRNKPRWITPQMVRYSYPVSRHYYETEHDYSREIAADDARHFLEAWRDANGGDGMYCIGTTPKGEFCVMMLGARGLGVIGFASREAAQHIIDTKPELLRALMPGVGK